MEKNHTNTEHLVRELAEKLGVAYAPTEADMWAGDITRLSGDDIVLDGVELLLVELQRAGYLTRPEALQLQVNHLREARI